MATCSISQTMPFAAGMCLFLLLAATKCVHSARLLVEQPPLVAPAPVVPSSSAAAPQLSNPASSHAVASPPAFLPAVQSIAPTDTEADDQSLIFFMHETFGGSQPSALILNNANTAATAGANALPTNTNSNSGNLPSKTTGLQSHLFGATTVIDNELTESQESGSKVIGRVQGLYIASSHEGNSQTLIATAMFNAEGDAACTDTLSFFGIYCPSSPDSPIAIVGGTGKYESAQGCAVVKSLPSTGQQETDSADTLLQFTIYLS